MAIILQTNTKAGEHVTVLESYQHGKTLATLVDNDADIDIITIDCRGAREKIIQLINTGAANGFDYTLYGTVKETLPTTFNLEEWESIVGPTGVALDTTKSETITKVYSYILVRAKRTVTLLDATVDVHYRGQR